MNTAINVLTKFSGGQHTGTEWKNTGFCGLAGTVQELGLQNPGPLQMDFLVSYLRF